MNVPVAVLAILRERSGLDPDILGASFLERVWRKTLKIHGSESACLAALAKNESAWTEMLDELVVPETWFFREEAAFAFLRQWLSKNWLPRNPGTPFRALSLPCASGEEAYSIAVTALESGLSAARVQIEAFDISPRAIAASKRGAYRGRSIRLISPQTIKSYFKTSGDSLHAGELLRSCIRFRSGNVLHANDGAAFPVVFCRNLLIYLAPEARQSALKHLQRALAPDGILFLGHADCIAGLDVHFEPLPVDGAFAYGHRSSKPAALCQERLSSRPRERSRTRSRILPVVRGAGKAPRIARGATAPEGLARARNLADQGSLDEARQQLLGLLKNYSELAEGWYLLGLVQSALGKSDEAELCYERTIALQPLHKEAELHRALLAAERLGDAK